jgi:hypothetical protein
MKILFVKVYDRIFFVAPDHIRVCPMDGTIKFFLCREIRRKIAREL